MSRLTLLTILSLPFSSNGALALDPQVEAVIRIVEGAKSKARYEKDFPNHVEKN